MDQTMWVTACVTDTEARSKPDVGVNRLAQMDYTALRAWGEALIVAAGRHYPDNDLAHGIRTRCIFSALASAPAEIPAPFGQVRLLVLKDKCGVGRQSAIDPVFAWPSWNELKAYLSALEFDEELVAELVSPTSYDEAFMKVDVNRAREFILHDLEPRVLEAILRYFAENLDAYIQSWTSLGAGPVSIRDESDWHVVVPESAIVEVSNV